MRVMAWRDAYALCCFWPWYICMHSPPPVRRLSHLCVVGLVVPNYRRNGTQPGSSVAEARCHEGPATLHSSQHRRRRVRNDRRVEKRSVAQPKLRQSRARASPFSSPLRRVFVGPQKMLRRCNLQFSPSRTIRIYLYSLMISHGIEPISSYQPHSRSWLRVSLGEIPQI
jgi:hypothetical protein